MVQKKKKKTLLFSIEVGVRELVPKCLLALESAERGFRVHIGSFRAMKRLKGKIRSCIFLHKSAWGGNASRLIEDIGAVFVFLDEEIGLALSRSNSKKILTRRFASVSSQEYSQVFSIGERYKEYMEQLENFEGIEIHALGWPRLDLWRPEFESVYREEARAIREELGAFYLLVSSFSTISESTYREEYKYLYEFYGPESASIADFKYREFKTCLRLIEEISPQLSEGERIVIRPHPSESIDEWETHVRRFDNVLIRLDGDVTPWLLACRGTIQFGSTVAVQASYMGIPSIQVKVGERAGLTDAAIYEILDSTGSVRDVYRLLKSSGELDRDLIRAGTVERLEGIVSSLDGELASSRIASALSEISVHAQPPIRFSIVEKFILWLREFGDYVGYLKKRKLFKQENRLKRSRFEKLPGGIRKADVEAILMRLARAKGLDPGRIRCRQVASNLVSIDVD